MKWLCTVGVAVSLALQPALADELFGNHPLTPQARDAFVTELLTKMTVDENNQRNFHPRLLTSQTKQGLPISASTAPAGRSPGKASARASTSASSISVAPSSMLTGSTLR